MKKHPFLFPLEIHKKRYFYLMWDFQAYLLSWGQFFCFKLHYIFPLENHHHRHPPSSSHTICSWDEQLLFLPDVWLEWNDENLTYHTNCLVDGPSPIQYTGRCQEETTNPIPLAFSKSLFLFSYHYKEQNTDHFTPQVPLGPEIESLEVKVSSPVLDELTELSIYKKTE